ncbi:MAG: hypothetical protein PHN35_03260 [Clostridia bacterium]|nr:hypothetical protein [Clostridia bacterium]MDD4797940.1 hypothetical protein [Clostridia bacterium]
MFNYGNAFGGGYGTWGWVFNLIIVIVVLEFLSSVTSWGAGSGCY